MKISIEVPPADTFVLVFSDGTTETRYSPDLDKRRMDALESEKVELEIVKEELPPW